MKSALTVVLFRLFLIGVFVDGTETSNVESLSVLEGDSVTLKSGVTKIQTDDEIEWMFSGSRIATISSDSGKISVWVKPDGSFKDRLQLDKQTGDLKISNIKTTDSGQYKPTVSSPRGSPPEITFTVKVVPADEVKPVTVKVTVLEGDSVTLPSGLTDIQTDDVNHVIQWRFGQQKSPVAEIINTSDERFRDRLQLDNQTGSLIITNIRTTDSGVYEVEISSSRYTIHHTQSFSVTISDDVESVSVLVGDNVTLRTGLTETQRDDQIKWKFGDRGELIASLKAHVNKIWSNIELNNQTGDLTIINIQGDKYVDYKVEINTRRMILHRNYQITMIDAVKLVSVKVGESVTLQIVTEIQKDDLIHWMFGDFIIAEIRKADRRFFTSDGPDWSFRGRLYLDRQTGSLTIMNTRITDSGEYQLKISSSRCTINRTITVTLSGVFSSEKDGVKTVSVVNGHSFTLHSNVTDLQDDVPIEWMFGPQNLFIAKTDGKSKKISYNNDVRFKNKVYLDNRTGDLSIQDSSTEHSGVYQLKIINSAYTIQKSFNVTFSAVSGSGLSPGEKAGISVGVLVVVAAVAVAYVICYRRWSKKPKEFSVDQNKDVKLLEFEAELERTEQAEQS